MGKLIEISATHSVAADNIAELYLFPGEAVVVVLRNGNHLPVDLNDGESLYDAYRRLQIAIQLSMSQADNILQLEADPRLYKADPGLHEALQNNHGKYLSVAVMSLSEHGVKHGRE